MRVDFLSHFLCPLHDSGRSVGLCVDPVHTLRVSLRHKTFKE